MINDEPLVTFQKQVLALSGKVFGDGSVGLSQTERGLLHDLFEGLDRDLAAAVGEGKLHKGSVLSVLMLYRDRVAMLDREFSERLIPRQLEAAIIPPRWEGHS